MATASESLFNMSIGADNTPSTATLSANMSGK